MAQELVINVFLYYPSPRQITKTDTRSSVEILTQVCLPSQLNLVFIYTERNFLSLRD